MEEECHVNGVLTEIKRLPDQREIREAYLDVDVPETQIRDRG